MKKFLVLLALVAGFAGQGYALEPTPYPSAEKEIAPITLMMDAVKYATISDAYSAYCTEKPSTLASGYLDQFDLDENITIEQKAELVGVMEKEVQAFIEKIKNDKPNCADVEFMLGRLEAMRLLKDVSYMLNGVDPATVPDDSATELRELLLSYDKDGVAPPASYEGEEGLPPAQ